MSITDERANAETARWERRRILAALVTGHPDTRRWLAPRGWGAGVGLAVLVAVYLVLSSRGIVAM